ncbi:MAG: peptide ABC transporter substrate-binding protein [Lachnospiraceae bacterium]|nr:peptide ABC transporter substrate-binding protein [Lachnospiraceae bacterium]
MKKKLLAFVLASAMVASLGACGNAGSKGSDKAQTEKSTEKKSASKAKLNSDTKTLYINLASEPQHLDPALNNTVDGACLAVNSFVGLYTYDKNDKLVPAIADGDPQVSDDGTEWTIKLKKTKWSDGSDLTAKDFVYSWNRAASEKTAADYGYLFDIVARNDDGSLKVEAPDDYTLKITLNNSCPYFNQLLAFPVFDPVPQKAVEAADPDGSNPGAWANEAGFVSNGAYTCTAWTHDSSMEYTKNPNFYDADNVKIEKLNFMLSADDTATFAAYNSGDLDFIDSISPDEVPNVKDFSDFYVADQLGTNYIGFNVNASIFDGMTEDQAKDFRKAVSLLIDRQYMVDTVGQTGQEVASSFVPTAMHDGNGKTWSQKYYDGEKTGASSIKKAVKLLESATGYKFKDNGDGTYTPSKAISFEFLTNSGTSNERAAQLIQDDLKKAGIQMTIKTEDWKVFIADRQNGNYTLCREGWIADYDDPSNMLEIFLTKSGNNDMQFGKNPIASAPQNWADYDKLLDQARTETDKAKRADLLVKAEKMLMDTNAVIPLYFYNDVYMMKSNVSGVYETLTGNKYFMYATKSAK